MVDAIKCLSIVNEAHVMRDVILFVLLHDYPDVDHLLSGPLSFHKARLFLIDLG